MAEQKQLQKQRFVQSRQRRQSAEVINLAQATQDKGYRFRDRDPDMEWVCNKITASGLSVNALHRRIRKTFSSGGISSATIYAWMSGKTRKPQNYSLNQVAYALGFTREWVEI